MTRKELKPAGVTFQAGPHIYTRNSDGKRLQGVTRMIQQTLYPDEFNGISPDVLNAKAAYGTRRHREIQDMIVFGDKPVTPAQRDFSRLVQEAGLVPIASEYTVTDGEEFASNIDVLCADCSIIDIKTVASLNRAKVSWQLSLYARMFEHVNPGCKAGRLYVVWLPKSGEPRLVEIPRRSENELDRLTTAWLTGTPYIFESRLDRPRIEQAAALKLEIEQLQKKYNTLSQEILAEMKEKGETSWSDDYCTVSFRSATTTKRFDSASFRKADPLTYQKYVRESATPESLALRLHWCPAD